MSATWLPNLVGGASIWKLAADLNEAKFFDGRLLVPETEGSESLPVSVRWDVEGLVPLAEARARFPEDVAAAERDFTACLERVAKVFQTPQSGFDKYKEAFTIPSFEADGGAHYFFSPKDKKLFVVNWGASPRDVAGKTELVFGYQDWGARFGAAAGAAGAAGAASPEEKKPEEKKPEEKKPEEKKPEEKKPAAAARPWWVWALLAGVFVGLILLIWWLLHACGDTTTGPDADGGDASALEAGADGATDALASDAALEGGEAGAEGDASDEAGAEAGASDGGDDGGGPEAGASDGGDDGGAQGDGGPGTTFTIDDDGEGDGSSGGASGSSGGGSSGGGGKITVTIGPGGGSKAGPRRRHMHPDAVHWRIATGKERVARTEEKGQRYDVFLTPGKTFQGVRVEWQDKEGRWHTH